MAQKTYQIKLTAPEIGHIEACMEDRKREGCYYGNREQFWNRHMRIERKLIEACDGRAHQSFKEA